MNEEFWNERYKTNDTVYGHQPNAFFKEQLLKLQPGKLLLPAEGEGRNALFAASIGWDVTAFDFSMLHSIKTLIEEFEGLQIIFCKEEDVFLNEGKFHAGIANVVRPLASQSAK